VKIWEKINEQLGFTRSEKRVVMFLVLAFVCGSIVKYVRLRSHPAPEFDYAASDSEFAVRSGIPDSSGTPAAVDGGDSMSGRGNGRDSVVNINTAGKTRLMRLPGIGEALAGRIMTWREEHREFHSVRELMNIRGIGRKKFARIEKLCTVK
jgi:competence ComEA-like helix-hairpin-helix protein